VKVSRKHCTMTGTLLLLSTALNSLSGCHHWVPIESCWDTV